MKRTKLAVVALSAVCAVALGSEAFARGGGGGGGGGQGARLRDGSCVNSQTGTASGGKAMQGQRLQDGSGAAKGAARQGAGQGKMRRLGPGDGTGNAVPPADGSGYGSPAKQ